VKRAKAAGFDDVLFLDGETGKHIEEASSCNVFMLKVLQNSIFSCNISTYNNRQKRLLVLYLLSQDQVLLPKLNHTHKASSL